MIFSTVVSIKVSSPALMAYACVIEYYVVVYSPCVVTVKRAWRRL